MQSIIRERILEQLNHVPRLVDMYSQKDANFSNSLYQWLQNTEAALEPFRLPLVSKLSSLRGLIVATDDGYLDPSLTPNARSARKQKHATHMLLLQQSEQVLRDKALVIDETFQEFREKISQILAVASEQEPLPAPQVMSVEYLDRIWKMSKSIPKNTTLALYLQARLAETDRRYLLQDIVTQLLDSAAN